MGFLKRLLGGGSTEDGKSAAGGAGSAPGSGDPALDEIERDRVLLREEALRLNDDLIQRQLRYADRSWTPPAQGGTRRAEDGDRPPE
jgi:hypothetical protein